MLAVHRVPGARGRLLHGRLLPGLLGGLLAGLLVGAFLLASVTPAAAADPTSAPSAAAATASAGPATTKTPGAAGAGDLRSSGQGAGAAGNPMGAVWAFAVVVVLGVALAGATGLYVRATRPRRQARRAPSRSRDSRDNAAT